MNELGQALEQFINDQLHQITISNPRNRECGIKVKIRPILLKEKLVFQAEEQIGKQMFHKNLEKEECQYYIQELLNDKYRQLELSSDLGTVMALVSKKGTMTVKVKKIPAVKIQPAIKSVSDANLPAGLNQADLLQTDKTTRILSHNRQKRYILEEGRPVPFLQDLGVMTADGKVVRSRYDKFRQINRFLEFIEDILPKLNKEKKNTIIDFGCGKSYLTFAMYYYLKVLKGYDIRVIGLDLKKDVITHCNQLSEKFGFDQLHFYHGDIADFEGVEQVDMVVTLHACDTATDYALAKAVGWGASVILSVPCCQHELNNQIQNDTLKPVLQYGIIKERMSALYTDGLRAEILENQGYRTQLLEFIDMEHTPKNILIRAVKQGKKKDNAKQVKELIDFLHVEPTLYTLMMKG